MLQPFRPVRFQKDQCRGNANQWKPSDVVEDDEVIRRMEDDHEHESEHARSPGEQQKSNDQIKNETGPADKIGQRWALQDALEKLQLAAG